MKKYRQQGEERDGDHGDEPEGRQPHAEHPDGVRRGHVEEDRRIAEDELEPVTQDDREPNEMMIISSTPTSARLAGRKMSRYVATDSSPERIAAGMSTA